MYADEIAILTNGKFPQTVSEVLQTVLCTVQQWCERTKLSVNPNKTVVIPFTRKRNIKGPKEPVGHGISSWIRSFIRPIRPSGHAEAHLVNLVTETKGGILDIHRGGKTHSYYAATI
jgi:hypothetical protein